MSVLSSYQHWSFLMAPRKIQTFKISIVALIGFLCFVAAVILFAFGGIVYTAEHSKVLNYANTMCVLDKNLFKSYVCVQYYFGFHCYVAAWSVSYNGHTGIVEGTKTHGSIWKALDEANKYKVSQ